MEAEDVKHKTKTLYIWGLDRSLAQTVVKEEFAKFVPITRVTIIKDKSTGTSKGFGYVECENPEDATKAMKEMDGRVIGENPVRIKYSFTDTPDWLKYLESKGVADDERPRQNNRGPPQDGFGFGFRGRGRGRGRGGGRERPPEGHGRGFAHGRYGDGGREPRVMDEDYYNYRTSPGRLDNFERRPREDPYKRRHDDERRPMDISYERRPLGEPMERSRPHDFERRPHDDPYDARPPVGRPGINATYDDERRLPPRRAPGEPFGGGRDDLYSHSSGDKRDVYQERRDLYRPSDREGYMDPTPGRDQPRGRSPPDSIRTQPVNYRARSPIDRPDVTGDIDHYERRPARERIPSSYYEGNRNTYSPAPLYADEGRRVPEAKPAVSDYRSVRESGGRPLYEGSYSERGPPERIGGGGRVPENRSGLYNDPYATVDSCK